MGKSEISNNTASISVVIPTLNRAAFLAEALQSVIQQTLPVYEIIVADSKSNDNSETIAKSFGEKVIFIRKQFRNQSEARNNGIAIAKGTYIAFLDSDDLWLENKIAHHFAHIQTHHKESFSYTDALVFDVTGKESPHSYVYKYQKENLYAGNIAEKLFREHNVIPTSSVIVKKSLLLDVGGFDEHLSYHEDRDLWIRLAQKGPVGFIHDALTVYRVHPSQFTTDNQALREVQWKLVKKKYATIFPL